VIGGGGRIPAAPRPPGLVPPVVAVVPTEEQRAAIEFGLQPLRIIAGAGTGKTMVMVERIAHLVATGQGRADQVLGLTFTNKAAAELKERVDRRLGSDADVTVSTYHGFGATLVARHLLDLDLHPRTRVLNRAEAWQLLFRVFDEFRFDKKRVFRPGLVVNDALTLASHCADHLVAIAAVEADARVMAVDARWKATREAAEGRRELCQIVAAYDREKRLRHLIDFDDQIQLAVVLLRQHPGLARRLGEQRPFVLLDEYQDTNFAQRVMLQLIYPTGSVVTAVGDDMQSIYAFRGAYLRNLLDFGSHFPPPGELALTENRRSGATIVALANRIQGQVTDAVPKQLTARPDGPPAAIECFLASDDLEEAAVIAADVARMGPPWSEHAVLCRKRRLIPAIAAALEAASIPVEVVGSSGLLDRPEIVDLVAWLELLADPSSSVALLRILGGPRYRIGRRDLACLARHAVDLRKAAATGSDDASPGRGPGGSLPGGSRDANRAAAPGEPGSWVEWSFGLSDALGDLTAVADLSARARARIRSLVAQWESLSGAARRLPVVDLAEVVAERTGLWSAVGPRGQENLLRFLRLAEDFAPVDGGAGLAAFVDYVALLDESEEDLAEAHPGDRVAVAVMTIHQAKGLEWDHVWIPGLAGSGRSRIFPDERGGDNPLSKQTALPWWLYQEDPGFGDWRTTTKDALDRAVRLRAREEEWRLLYVACTRARRQVVCSAAQWYPGPAVPQGPSEFYAFVASQVDLVTERFRREPPAVDPHVSEMRARQVAGDRRAMAPAAAAPSQPTLFDRPAGVPVPVAPPSRLSVTDLVSLRRCPRQYYWLAVRPLPRRSSAAARLGTAAHRWIEQRASNQLGLPGLLEPEAAPDDFDPGAPVVSLGARGTGVGDDAAEPFDRPDAYRSALAGVQSAFLSSPYGALEPRRVEAPFVLAVAGRVVRGRVDAVYHRDGRVDIVDFKTGQPPADGDPGASVQLDTYAVAAVDVWSEDPAGLRTTYCYLDADGRFHLTQTEWTSSRVAEARTALTTALGSLAGGGWPATPGAWCRRCEWRQVCRAGRAFLAGGSPSGPVGPG
jgi:DNA helicase-2/ATP-dependent DNA helicase PcrA